MKKVLVLPYWVARLVFYKDHPNLIVRIGDLLPEDYAADLVIGFSMGALIVLKAANKIKGQIILINPPLPKQNLFVWFFAWLKYVFAEGLFLERQHFTKNPVQFLIGLAKHIKLFLTDFNQNIKSVKDRLTVVRGKVDNYFCTGTTVNFFESMGVKVEQVDGGHNWGEGVEGVIS